MRNTVLFIFILMIMRPRTLSRVGLPGCQILLIFIFFFVLQIIERLRRSGKPLEGWIGSRCPRTFAHNNYIKKSYCKQQSIEIINNIKMTTSLPKIKTLTNNSQSGSQKQLKFIKLKLNTSQSEADIRQRFKSVKTERLSKLQRYSTVHEQRQYKNEKIQLNLLERKLMTGTYDQTTQRGNDLNSLKQKTDFYKTQSAMKQVQIEKYKKALQDLKKQAQGYISQKTRKQQIISKIQRKYENQKSKTDTIVSQKVSLQYMIAERQNVNLFIESKMNENKIYVTKLKSIVRQTDGELRQSTQNMRNLMSKIKKINNELERQQRNREQIIQSKQVIIGKRKDDEKLREQRSIEYKKSLDEANVEIEQKGLADLCKSVSANIFIQKYCEITKNSLEQKYQLMENMYNKICSYRKFDSEHPQNMIQRFKNLKEQTTSYENNCKKLQENQGKLQKRYNQLLNKYNQSRIISKKPQTAQNKQRKSSPDKFQEKQMAEIQYQKKLNRNSEDTSQLFYKIDSIGRWSERYARQMNIRVKKNLTSEDISRNILNILKVVQDEAKSIEEFNKKKEASI